MNGNHQLRIDYTNKDYSSLRQALLELAREKLPDWTDHSPNDPGVLLLELFAYVADIQLYYQDRIANESYLDTAVERRSIINLLRLIGYELRSPQPASADLTLLFREDAEGTISIETGAEFQTAAKGDSQSVNFQYVRERLTINTSDLSVITHQGKNYKRFEWHTQSVEAGPNQKEVDRTLPVVQVDAAVSNEIVGSSDASASQRFALARAPLIKDSLVVSVDEGTGPKAWEQVATLLYSGPSDEHYIVRHDEHDVAWIEFGDNRYGRIPGRGHNNITAEYRAGGGIKGNVAARTITRIVSNIDQLSLVYNEQPATGGADAEPLQEAVLRGPRRFRAMGRAVTAQDYEEHAMAFGLGKARAVAGAWNRIELFVAPAGGGCVSDTLKEDLRRYFENKRIMTSLVEIRDPAYIDVDVEGTLDVEPYYFSLQVQQRVQNAIKELLAFDHVNFGEERLYLSKVYEAIENVEGVVGVQITRFAIKDSLTDLPQEHGKLRFAWNEIPRATYAEGILIKEVRGGRP